MKPIKQTYLVLLIVISLFSLAVYSTYAMFMSEVDTNDIVSINTTVSIDSNIDQYEFVSINANDYKIIEFNISNIKEESFYYGVWYQIISGDNYDVRAYKLSNSPSLTVDIIKLLDKKKISIVLINDTNKKVTCKLGIATSKNSSLNITTNKSLIVDSIDVDDISNKNAATYLNDIQDDDDSYYKDDSLIYYGVDPNNYVLFNEELYRIIDVYNSRIRMISVNSIGKYQYDYYIDNKDNNNVTSSIVLDSEGATSSVSGVIEENNSNIYNILNKLYYNSSKGECYKNNTLSMCDFTANGLSEDARKLLDRQEIYEKITASDLSIVDVSNLTGIVKNTYYDYLNLLDYKDYLNSYYCADNLLCDNVSWLNVSGTLLSTKNVIDDLSYSITIDSDLTVKTDNNIFDEFDIRPVVMLKENVYLVKGNGSIDNPYVFK